MINKLDLTQSPHQAPILDFKAVALKKMLVGPIVIF